MEPEEQGAQSAVKPLVSIDSATGLLNSHGWVAYAKRHLKRAVYSQQRLGLVFLRVQNFAGVRAEHGYEAVEEGMQQLAQSLQVLVRPGDLLGRWRADDFIVLLPYVDGNSLEMIAERLADGLRRKPVLVDRLLVPPKIVIGGASLVVTRGELHELDALLADGERQLLAASAR